MAVHRQSNQPSGCVLELIQQLLGLTGFPIPIRFPHATRFIAVIAVHCRVVLY